MGMGQLDSAMRDSASRQRAGILTMHFAAGAPQRPRPRNGLRCWHEVVDKAQEALSQAKQAHEERAAAIEAERVALENRSEAEEVENQAGDRSTPSARLGARPCARRTRAKGFLPSEGLRRLVSYLSFRAIASTSSLRSERGFLPREGVRIRSTCIDRSDTAETGQRNLEDDQLLDRAPVRPSISGARLRRARRRPAVTFLA